MEGSDVSGFEDRKPGDRHGILEQLCGELLLRKPPTVGPPHDRAAVAVGLELFDLFLNPDHVVRATEKLTLMDTVTLSRRFDIDISLDRLSVEQEDNAAQLSALMSERIADPYPATPTWSQHLWLPLVAVPRPCTVPVTVTDATGHVLPRPRQADVLAVLEAALYHLFNEALMEHPSLDEPYAPLTEFRRHDQAARGLFQGTLRAVCEDGRNSPRSLARAEALGQRLAALGGEGVPMLPTLIDAEPDRHRRRALHALEDVVAGNRPLLELFGMVHSSYFLVVGLENVNRQHHVSFSMPDVEALDQSASRSLRTRVGRALDPREHNFTIRVHVPIPVNVRRYRLDIDGETECGAERLNVSLVAAIRFNGRLAKSSLATLETCAGMLDGFARLPDGSLRTVTSEEPCVRFLASQALAALDSLEDLALRQQRVGAELTTRWPKHKASLLDRAARDLTCVASTSLVRVATAKRRMLGLLSSAPSGIPTTDEDLAGASLHRVAAAFEHPLMGFELVSQERPGSEVGRISVNQSGPASHPEKRPHTMDVWVTISDETRPHAREALLPALGIATLVYLIGAFLFGTPLWPFPFWWDISSIRENVAAAQPDAIVALLLLIPAFALTKLPLPDQRNVAGLLRRPAQLLVISAMVSLCLAAVVMATPIDSSSPRSGAVRWVAGTLDATLLIFVIWLLWSLTAHALRNRYIWRPKGLPKLFWPDGSTRSGRPPPPSRLKRARRALAYDNKAPNAEFDLRKPVHAFPSHGKES